MSPIVEVDYRQTAIEIELSAHETRPGDVDGAGPCLS